MVRIVDDHGQEYNWFIRAPRVQGITVKKLQADGDELVLILTKIQNIPLAPGKNVMVWSGDIAQFIFDNALP